MTKQISASFENMKSGKVKRVVLLAGIYTHWVSYIFWNEAGLPKMSILDSKNREILDLNHLEVKEYIEKTVNNLHRLRTMKLLPISHLYLTERSAY